VQALHSIQSKMTQNQCLPVRHQLQKEELHFVSVALSGNPGAARTLNLASSNTLAFAVLPTTVSFNTTNWNIPQSILVSGISDANIVAEAVTITGSGVGLVSAHHHCQHSRREHNEHYPRRKSDKH
jgi:hypothetical protein